MTGSHRLLATIACAVPLAAAAQSTQEMNASNNPLTPSIGANLQDQYVGRAYGLGDEDSNAFLFRGTLPAQAVRAPADPAGHDAGGDDPGPAAGRASHRRG